MEKRIKFRSDAINGLLKNEGDCVGGLFRSLDINAPITLCQGYGVGSSTPLRVLAYAVPVLRLARQLPRHVKIEFYWATQGVLRANSVANPDEVVRSGQIARTLLEKYIRAFHPELHNQVRILEDVALYKEAEQAVSFLLPQAERVASEIPAIASFIDNRGGATALQYMVEHALYMRDPIELRGEPLPLIVDGMEYPDGHLIMIGGPSEKIFWRMRQQLLQRTSAHDRWKSHQFFTGVGDPPTYHPQQGEPYADVELERSPELDLPMVLAKAETVGSGPLRDWLILLQDAARVERFTITPKTRGGEPEQAILQQGFDALTAWLCSS